MLYFIGRISSAVLSEKCEQRLTALNALTMIVDVANNVMGALKMREWKMQEWKMQER